MSLVLLSVEVTEWVVVSSAAAAQRGSYRGQELLLILLADGYGGVVVESLRHQLQCQWIGLTFGLLGEGQELDQR